MDIYPNLCGTVQETDIINDEQICSTCLKKNSITIKITDLDYDGRTFLEKMKACISTSLEVDRENIPRICLVCISTLNLCFKFKKTAINSLKTLKLVTETVIEYDDEDSGEVKTESDYSDEHTPYPNDNEFAETTELNEAVLLLTKLTEKETTGEYNCKECSSIFSEKSKLDKHMVKIHNEKLTCELCGKEFKLFSRLKDHVMSHSRENSFDCSHCKKSFSRMSSLKRHMTTHYAPPGQKSKKTPFLCTICGKSFPFSNGATRHMRIHFGIKTHECSICHKQFNQSTHLQVHMRTHSGEKPYICEVCGDSFTLKAGLHKHTRAKHKEEDVKPYLDNVFFHD